MATKRIFKSERDRVLTYQRVLGTGVDARKVLADLYYRFMAYDPIGPDPMNTFILVGKQAVIREVMRTLGKDHTEMEEDVRDARTWPDDD